VRVNEDGTEHILVMARNDHYISQTYLWQFASHDGYLLPYYENTQVVVGKPKRTKSICFETEGDANKYFGDPRILDKFRPALENTWENNIVKLEKGILNSKTKYELAGYVAFLRLCTPTAKRTGQQMIAGAVEPVHYKEMLSVLEKADYLSHKNKAILRDAIQNREIKIEIDREFAHAQGIRALEGATNRYYCSHWLVLINETDIPFITSDNPAIQYYEDVKQTIAQTYVPLKPSMALLITFDLDMCNPSFEDVQGYRRSKDRFGVIKESYVKKFNEAIVKSAERIVLHQKKEDWIEQLVAKFRRWRVEAIVSHIPTDRGTIVISRNQPIEIND
jgi:hypothetical protein